MRDISVGLIGYGIAGAVFHAPLIRACPQLRLAAVASSRKEQVEALGVRAVPTVALLPPDDQLVRALIIKFCADRQMAVDEPLVSYLATRIERSYAAVRQAVERLDSEALRLGRPVTRALAAELLRNG